jgi:hypothetical protein
MVAPRRPNMETKSELELLALLALIEGGTVEASEVLICARRGKVPVRNRKVRSVPARR